MYYFTIFVFVKAYEHFNDPEWDGEPLEPAEAKPRAKAGQGDEKDGGDDEPGDDKDEKPKKIVVKLADGKERTIQHMMATSFWGPDGKPISAAQFVERLFGDLPAFFKNEDELRAIWCQPDTRKSLLAGLSEKGYGRQELDEIRKMINAEKSDLFDVLAYIAFTSAPVTREARVVARKSGILRRYDTNFQAFLDFVLSQYVSQGDGELSQEKLGNLLSLKYHTVSDAAAQLGGVPVIRDTFFGFQRYLYE
jgi:type I restriction enzyme R subunit